MALTTSARKRSHAQAIQSENENPNYEGVRRRRKPTQRQQLLNEGQAARLQATIDRQRKELAKQRQRLAGYRDEDLNINEDESGDSDVESQDEDDIGFGARPGGGFTSVITSKGTIPQRQSIARKKQLVIESDLFLDEHESLQALDVNCTRRSEPATNYDDSVDADENMAPPSSRLSTPLSSIPPSRVPSPGRRGRTAPSLIRRERTTPPLSPRVRHEHTAPPPQPPPPPAQIRRERTTPSPSPHAQPERTIPPASPSRSQQTQATPPSPPRMQATPPSPPHTQATPSSPPRTQATPSSPPRTQATPSSPSRTQATPSSPPQGTQATPSSPPRNQATQATPSLPCSEANSRVRLPVAPFRHGYTPGQKPKASDYEDKIEKMLLNAMHEYACLILSTDAFPSERKQTEWAETTWRAACELFGAHYECSVRMVRLITSRGSWARGFLKDAARNNFKIFKFKSGPTEEIKRYNQDLRLSLLRDDAFHHKDPKEIKGFGEHRVVIDILRDALFENAKAYGVKYSHYFNPISINLLALVFTMIEFLINEWSTGERRKATFHSRTHSEAFDAHCLRTKEWCDLDQMITLNIRKRMFRTLMKKAGASADGTSGNQAITGMTNSMKERAKEALVGRTGETDDEEG